MRRTQREVLGPGVGSVAIIAKKYTGVQPDFMITQRRQQEDTRRAAMELASSNKEIDFKAWTDASIFPNICSVNGSKFQIIS